MNESKRQKTGNGRTSIVLGALVGCLVVAVFATPARTQEREVWDVEFTGKGDPRDVGFEGKVVNGSTFNFYDKFTNSDVFPGWMTANGNPGGYFYKEREDRNTKAAGWTAEWLLALTNSGRGMALNFNDDTSLVKVIYDAPANTVTLSDSLIELEGNKESVRASVDLDNQAEHTYRLVRKPQSPKVELYIDNGPVAVASIAPWRAADHGEAAQLNRVVFAHSSLNAAWDFFRYHRGAASPRLKTIRDAPPRPIPGKAGTARDGYQIYVASSAIHNAAILAGQPLPAVWRKKQTMSVLCARGEYEPATFLILTDQPLQQVMVLVGDLSGPGGVLPSESVDARVAQKLYRPITWQCVTLPWVLVHDPSMFSIVEGHPKWITEIQPESWKSPAGQSFEEYKAGHSKINRLRKELIDADTLQAADIDDYRQFWLTVRVPAAAKSGTYRGEVKITAANAPTTTLTLDVTVPAFDLLQPPFEYSIYYPTHLEGPSTTDTERERYHPLTERQYLAECRNMVAHGCMNPCIYAGPGQDDQGNIHFTHLSRLLDLRERAGMPKGVMLYLMDGAGMAMKQGELTRPEKQRTIEVAQTTVAWARARGYSGALFMGADEYSGAALRAMRECYQSVRDGGSGIWVAGGRDLVDFMSDVVDVPIFAHPGALAVDARVQWHVDSVEWLLHPEKSPNWDPEILLTPGYQEMIKAAHKNGNKIFSYFDPQGGQPFPEYHRRHRGLGLWKTGLNGTMTWAYVHIWTRTIRTADPEIVNNGVGMSSNSFVLRGPSGPLDTLSWEGYREGYDDARYLATLKDAIAKATAAGKHRERVAQTELWLDSIATDADLDVWRREMARRTETLLGD